MIECTFQKVRQYSCIPKKKKEKFKFGRYLSSTYPISGFGQSRWVVGANIVLEKKQRLTEENKDEIAKGCIAFLNTPLPNKSGLGRKRTRCKYGKFEDVPFKTILKRTKGGKQCLQVFLVTESRKHRAFWGEGPKIVYFRKKRSTAAAR